MTISNFSELTKTKYSSGKDQSKSIITSKCLNKIKNCDPCENVIDPSNTSQKSEKLTLTKASSQKDDISIESKFFSWIEYKKMREISNQCIFKMKQIKKDEEDYEKLILILINYIEKQKVSFCFNRIILSMWLNSHLIKSYILS